MNLQPDKNLPQIIHRNEQFWTTSLDMVEKFEKNHKIIIALIKNLKCSKSFIESNFRLIISQDPEVENYYLISRDGFSYIALGLKGEKAEQWRMKYIERFKSMERIIKRALSQQASKNWIEARVQSIIPQKQKTDVIQRFVEYAIAQGSKNPKKYFLLIQEMEYNSLFEGGYKHLKMLAGYFNKSKILKDLLNINQLFTLINADRIVEKTFDEGMKSEIFYKDIFKLAKQKVLAFADLIGKDQISFEKPLLEE